MEGEAAVGILSGALIMPHLLRIIRQVVRKKKNGRNYTACEIDQWTFHIDLHNHVDLHLSPVYILTIWTKKK